MKPGAVVQRRQRSQPHAIIERQYGAVAESSQGKSCSSSIININGNTRAAATEA
jgi:hypothetical protein